jgi:hypothetical protein
MPRTYKLKRPYPFDRDDKIKQCLQVIEDGGVSIREACAEFCLPLTTMHRHLTASFRGEDLPSRGGMSSLPRDIQTEIAAIAKIAATHGFGLFEMSSKTMSAISSSLIGTGTMILDVIFVIIADLSTWCQVTTGLPVSCSGIICR